MRAFLAGQLDFILLGYALALAFLGAVSAFIRRAQGSSIPWDLLALFAFSHAASELMQVAEESLSVPESLKAARIVVAVLSFAFLAEFGRRTLATCSSRVPGPWIHLVLLAAVAILGRGAFAELRVLFRYAFGVGGALAAAGALFLTGGRDRPTRPLRLAAMLLAAYALTTGISVDPGRVFPASVLNSATFLAIVGVPIELVRGLLVGALSLALFGHHLGVRRAEFPGLPDDRAMQGGIVGVLAGMMVGGWFLTEALGRLEARDLRAELSSQAATAAAILHATAHGDLTGADPVRSAAGEMRLRGQLSIIRGESPHVRRLFLLERRGGEVATVADSDPLKPLRNEPPGARQELPGEVVSAVFATGHRSITGPTLGRLTALAPIHSLTDGEVVAVLGYEIDAGRLHRVVTRGRLTGIVVTLGLVHLLMAFAYYRQRSWESDRMIDLSERRLRDAQAISHVGSWTLDFSTGRMSWSREMFAVVGRDPALPPPSAEEYDGYFLPEDAARRREALARSRIDGKPYELALRLRREDGELRHLVSLVWPERDDTHEVARVLGTTADVTERVRAEEAARGEMERARQYLDVANVMMVVIDADEKIALVNRKACEVLGYGATDLVGRNWFDAVVLDRERPRSRSSFEAVLKGRMDLAATFENRILTRNAEERLISWNNAQIRDGSGKAIAVLCSGEEITERRRVEDSVMELNATLELRVMERTAEIEKALGRLQIETAERERAEEALLKRQAERLSAAEALNSVSTVLTEVTLDYEAALDSLARHLAAMEGDACLVSLLSDDGKWLYPVAFHHVDSAKEAAGRTIFATHPHRLGRGLATSAVIADGRARLVPSLTRTDLGELVRPEHEPLLATFEPTSIALAPMRAHGRVLGTLALLSDDASSPLSEDNKALLQATADRAALTLTTSRLYAKNLAQAEALRQTNLDLEEKVAARTDALEQANAKLEQLATHDGLTELLNRRHFDAVLSQECRRSARRGDALAVLMCDVDFFKRYNDRYGHGAGDECLKRIANCLRSVFRRASDFTARYGGEEFVVVAAETPPEYVSALADRLRAEMASLGIPHEASDAASVVTVSIGAVSAIAGSDRNPAWYLAQADAALYRAKAAGRNRAVTVVVEGAPAADET